MKYDPLNYKLSELNTLEPAKGRIVISDPFLPDPYFKRSVVLLVEHNEEGSLGFILNKTLDISLNDTELEIPDDKHKIYFGGPVQSTDLFYVHKLGEQIENCTSIGGGLYWGGDFHQLEDLLRSGIISSSDIRFFIGYSGWDANQLQGEIDEDSWLVLDTDLPSLLEADSENLWKSILSQKEGKLFQLSTFPEDPNMN